MSESGVIAVAVEDEMQRSYLEYAMSVIVGRALPDVRDGLKPVHRRILYAMYESGYTRDKHFRKSARVVGEVIGKYHPHGDQAVYDAMVRMAQPFSMRLPLIEGQGNFGSPDGDPAAAMRYTEARLSEAAERLMRDLGNGTVAFRPNYDGQESEPTVMPAEFPNLLINGANGIAVGMAGAVPPHNPGEVLDACVALLDNPELSVDELMQIVPGPDFPGGGLMIGNGGIRAFYETGHGGIIMRGGMQLEEVEKGRTAIVIDSLPYAADKPGMLRKIAELAQEKVLEGVAELRDESAAEGTRIVLELKRDAQPEVLMRQLYRHTPLQTSFHGHMLVLNGGRPEVMSLRAVLQAFNDFRAEVITSRLRFILNRTRDRAHVLCGLATAVEHIDETVRMIRSSRDAAEARARLLAHDWPAAQILPYLRLIDDPEAPMPEGETYRLTERQVKALLDLRLQRLTALGREEITSELVELAEEIRRCLHLLSDRAALRAQVRLELLEVRERLAQPRRTQIIAPDDEDESDEALIPRENMLVMVTAGGYIMRVSPELYRTQNRGGRGKSGMSTRDEDTVTAVLSVDTHTPLRFFTDAGKVYSLKVYRLPLGTPQQRGRPLVNLLPLEPGERVTSMVPYDVEAPYLLFVTAKGNVRRSASSDFADVPKRGKIAMSLDEGDAVVAV